MGNFKLKREVTHYFLSLKTQGWKTIKLVLILLIVLFITGCSDESEECVRFAELEFSECVAEDVVNLCTQVTCRSGNGPFVLGLEGQDYSDIDCSSFECENLRFFIGEDVVIEDRIEFTNIQFEERGDFPGESEFEIFGFIEVDGELLEFACQNFD